MVITESLARGLRADFWQLLDEEGRRLMMRVNSVIAAELKCIPASTTKVVNRHIKLLNDAVKNSPLALQHGVCGTKHKSKWWVIYPQVDRSRPLNDWNESCLRFDVHRINVSPFRSIENWYSFLLGEHCVARVFQRMHWEAPPAAKDIFPELKELAGWLPWFSIIDNLSTKLGNGRVLFVFLPTSNGVFLGSHHPDDFGIFEIRTYVSKKQLSPRQLGLWTAIMDVRKSTPDLQIHLGALVAGTSNETQEGYMRCLDAIKELVSINEEFIDVLFEELLEQHPSLARPASRDSYRPRRDVSNLLGYVKASTT